MSDKTLDAMNRAAGELPPGWTITIEIERDAGNVVLYDAEGNEHEFPCQRESTAQDILDALDYAQDQTHTGPRITCASCGEPTDSISSPLCAGCKPMHQALLQRAHQQSADEPQITREQWEDACNGLGTKG